MSVFDWIDHSWEVQKAHMSRKPVIAIETAGIFEAFPYPVNIKAANKVANAIRELGVYPAFIAIIRGRIKVGLEDEEMEYLAKQEGPLTKASRRDIPMLLAKKMDALTSASGAMMIAELANIHVVSGGGIGGVHRGFSSGMDISSDLVELTRSNVIMVCSGAKSILDLPKTMEYLETNSVCVAGFRTSELPAYMAIHSGCMLDFKLDTPRQVVDCFRIKNELGMQGGLLLTNPIHEKYAVDEASMQAAIEKALQKAEEAGIQGKTITKFIMDIVKQEMGEDSVDAGIHMNVDNAILAAQIAKEM